MSKEKMKEILSVMDMVKSQKKGKLCTRASGNMMSQMGLEKFIYSKMSGNIKALSKTENSTGMVKYIIFLKIKSI